MAGCSTITNPDNELRVTEYGGKGSYLGQIDGKIGGVRVVAKGAINGCLEYKGSKAKFTSEGCSK
jgi:hypothetical protein